METLTIRLPDDKHKKLTAFARSKGMTVVQLIEHLSSMAIAEFDTFTRFQAMVKKGNPQRGIELLDKLDSLSS
ncbi:MAG: toxin-antitoxin system HicB family antitoxin [Phormidesmis sp.]